MSRIKHLAAYMFRTLTVRNVRLTRKSKISRYTWLRLLHYPKTYGMSCVSSVEIWDVSQNAPCHLHVPNPYGTECASYEKNYDFPINSAPAFALSKTYGMSCASSVGNRGCLA